MYAPHLQHSAGFKQEVYRATHPVIPPSSAYGLLLNLGAIDMRGAVAGPITLIRSDVPLLRMAIGVVTPAERCSLYQQLHTYPVGNSGAEFKSRTHGAKHWITPVRREVLVGLDCLIGAQADDVDLLDRVRRGLKGELDATRYGLPFVGDNNFLIVASMKWLHAIRQSFGMRACNPMIHRVKALAVCL